MRFANRVTRRSGFSRRLQYAAKCVRFASTDNKCVLKQMQLFNELSINPPRSLLQCTNSKCKRKCLLKCMQYVATIKPRDNQNVLQLNKCILTSYRQLNLQNNDRI